MPRQPRGKQATLRVGFLTDDKGNKSAMRLMAFISLLAAIVFSGLIFVNFAKNRETRFEMLNKVIDKPEQLANIQAILENDKTLYNADGMSIVWAFLGFAFGGKALQKWAEVQSPEETIEPLPEPPSEAIEPTVFAPNSQNQRANGAEIQFRP